MLIRERARRARWGCSRGILEACGRRAAGRGAPPAEHDVFETSREQSSAVRRYAQGELSARVSTLTSPPTRAPYDPGEVTSREPGVAYGLGATRRSSGACSAFTTLSFPCSYQIAKLVAHA